MGTQNSGSSVDTESVKTKRRGLFSKEADEGYVPNRELFAYSAALAGQNLTYQFVTQWLFYFCTDVLKIGARKVGFFTGFSRIWDALNDPIVGAVIDRRRCKNGKKLHPYLGKLPIFIGILTAPYVCGFRRGRNRGHGNNPLRLYRLGFYIFISGCCPVGYDVVDFAAPSRASEGFSVA